MEDLVGSDLAVSL